MPLAHAFKHLLLSWKLFPALLVGIILASTFFAGVDIKANVTARQALDQELSAIAEEKTVSYVDELGARITEIQTQLQQLDEDIKTGGGEYLEKKASRKLETASVKNSTEWV